MAALSSSLLAVVVDCRDPRSQAEFWSRVLSGRMVERNPGEFLVTDPSGVASPFYFMAVPEPLIGKNRLHLDLLTEGLMGHEVERLINLGAALGHLRQDPGDIENPDTFAVMQDPEGHVFCVSSSTTLTGWE